MPLPPPSLKGRALRKLAAREHSRAELAAKLKPYEEEPGQLDRVLDDLQSKGFIDESRVLASVLHQRAGKLGARRIRQELQAKGLDPSAVREAVAQLQGTELARASQVWHRKFGEPPADAAARAKQMRFLAARGFGAETVARVLDAAKEGWESERFASPETGNNP